MKKLIISTIAAAIAAGLGIWFVVGGGSEEVPVLQRGVVEKIERLETRARAGDLRAQVALGRVYEKGEGIKPDPVKARDWYKLAAEKNYNEAHYALGMLYADPEIPFTSYSKAAEHFRQAANIGGHAEAQYELGRLYYKGRGVPNDLAEAFKLYRRAAVQGHPVAQYLLGTMHNFGWGVRIDKIEAYVWLSLALPKADAVKAANKDYNLEKILGELVAGMNRYQKEAGDKKIRKWRKKLAPKTQR